MCVNNDDITQTEAQYERKLYLQAKVFLRNSANAIFGNFLIPQLLNAEFLLSHSTELKKAVLQNHR